MDQQYDDTNRGAFFAPRDNNVLVGQGKLNNNGDEEYHVIVKATLPSGKVIREVYKKVGILFENESQNPKAPHLSGDYEDRRLAVWFATSQAGNDYMDAKVSDKTANGSPQSFTGSSNQSGGMKYGSGNIEEFTDEVPF
jgi:hypothetical protein